VRFGPTLSTKLASRVNLQITHLSYLCHTTTHTHVCTHTHTHLCTHTHIHTHLTRRHRRLFTHLHSHSHAYTNVPEPFTIRQSAVQHIPAALGPCAFVKGRNKKQPPLFSFTIKQKEACTHIHTHTLTHTHSHTHVQGC